MLPLPYPTVGSFPTLSLHAGLGPFPITTGSLAQDPETMSKHLWVWSHIPQNTTPHRVSLL